MAYYKNSTDKFYEIKKLYKFITDNKSMKN